MAVLFNDTVSFDRLTQSAAIFFPKYVHVEEIILQPTSGTSGNESVEVFYRDARRPHLATFRSAGTIALGSQRPLNVDTNCLVAKGRAVSQVTVSIKGRALAQAPSPSPAERFSDSPASSVPGRREDTPVSLPGRADALRPVSAESRDSPLVSAHDETALLDQASSHRLAFSPDRLLSVQLDELQEGLQSFPRLPWDSYALVRTMMSEQPVSDRLKYATRDASSLDTAALRSAADNLRKTLHELHTVVTSHTEESLQASIGSVYNICERVLKQLTSAAAGLGDGSTVDDLPLMESLARATVALLQPQAQKATSGQCWVKQVQLSCRLCLSLFDFINLEAGQQQAIQLGLVERLCLVAGSQEFPSIIQELTLSALDRVCSHPNALRRLLSDAELEASPPGSGATPFQWLLGMAMHRILTKKAEQCFCRLTRLCQFDEALSAVAYAADDLLELDVPVNETHVQALEACCVSFRALEKEVRATSSASGNLSQAAAVSDPTGLFKLPQGTAALLTHHSVLEAMGSVLECLVQRPDQHYTGRVVAAVGDFMMLLLSSRQATIFACQSAGAVKHILQAMSVLSSQDAAVQGDDATLIDCPNLSDLWAVSTGWKTVDVQTAWLQTMLCLNFRVIVLVDHLRTVSASTAVDAAAGSVLQDSQQHILALLSELSPLLAFQLGQEMLARGILTMDAVEWFVACFDAATSRLSAAKETSDPGSVTEKESASSKEGSVLNGSTDHFGGNALFCLALQTASQLLNLVKCTYSSEYVLKHYVKHIVTALFRLPTTSKVLTELAGWCSLALGVPTHNVLELLTAVKVTASDTKRLVVNLPRLTCTLRLLRSAMRDQAGGASLTLVSKGGPLAFTNAIGELGRLLQDHRLPANVLLDAGRACCVLLDIVADMIRQASIDPTGLFDMKALVMSMARCCAVCLKYNSTPDKGAAIPAFAPLTSMAYGCIQVLTALVSFTRPQEGGSLLAALFLNILECFLQITTDEPQLALASWWLLERCDCFLTPYLKRSAAPSTALKDKLAKWLRIWHTTTQAEASEYFLGAVAVVCAANHPIVIEVFNFTSRELNNAIKSSQADRSSRLHCVLRLVAAMCSTRDALEFLDNGQNSDGLKRVLDQVVRCLSSNSHGTARAVAAECVAEILDVVLEAEQTVLHSHGKAEASLLSSAHLRRDIIKSSFSALSSTSTSNDDGFSAADLHHNAAHILSVMILLDGRRAANFILTLEAKQHFVTTCLNNTFEGIKAISATGSDKQDGLAESSELQRALQALSRLLLTCATVLSCARDGDAVKLDSLQKGIDLATLSGMLATFQQIKGRSEEGTFDLATARFWAIVEGQTVTRADVVDELLSGLAWTSARTTFERTELMDISRPAHELKLSLWLQQADVPYILPSDGASAAFADADRTQSSRAKRKLASYRLPGMGVKRPSRLVNRDAREGSRRDRFRSDRKGDASRAPSMHVDDFMRYELEAKEASESATS